MPTLCMCLERYLPFSLLDLNELAEEYNCYFSLYVDDMTFSSDFPIKATLRDEVSDVLRKNGLLAKSKKDHYYQVNDFKVVC